MSEKWKPVPGFERYEVSDAGRVRSMFGRTHRRRTPKVLKARARGTTSQVGLVGADGKPRYREVGRLVLLAFVRPPLGDEVAWHKNGNGLDNRLANLEWISRAEAADRSQRKSFAHRVRGEDVAGAKLTEDQVREIYAAYRDRHANQRQLSECYGVHQTVVNEITKGRTWRHVTGGRRLKARYANYGKPA